MKNCSHKKIRLAYPQHLPTPEDLLHFIESTNFSARWAELGLNDEEDMTSLQLCIMAHPEGDVVIEGTNGLRLHRHHFQRSSGVQFVTAYYAYFPDFGVVYLNCIATGRERLRFSEEALAEIKESLAEVERELERLKTIRVRNRPLTRKDGEHIND